MLADISHTSCPVKRLIITKSCPKHLKIEMSVVNRLQLHQILHFENRQNLHLPSQILKVALFPAQAFHVRSHHCRLHHRCLSHLHSFPLRNPEG